MNKKTVRTAMGVVLGIAAFTILSTAISLFFSAVLYKDLATLGAVEGELEKTMAYVKNSSIGLVCVVVVVLTSYFFTIFTKRKKVFAPISAGLSLLLIIMCLAFLFDLRGIVMKFEGYSMRLACYQLASEYFSELITVMISALITCAYFTVATVFAFKQNKAATPKPEKANKEEAIQAQKENSNNEEVAEDEKA